ncbi:unnamed protein product [Allacma fusca]|uniref:C-CAP/cofactor C-like domain-containing protein n=1 Tax=Allacma fusca TaxID=39272 RepID=A0A8J2LWD8_9HEXA|nr:unnamed protein product [Allacma fusca]
MGCSLSDLNCCFTSRPGGRGTLNFTDLTTEGDHDTEVEQKVYSWDVREKKPACIIENAKDCEVIRQSKGEQVIVRNCVNSRIYLLDWTSSATIDDCRDCVIIVAAVGGSLFMRDTNSTTLVAASAQLRLRDCGDIHLFSGCESDPIIESSQNVLVAPYFLSYKGIDEHFKAANLDPFKAIHWGNVYDFTPSNPPNWSKLKEPFDMNKFIPPPGTNDSLLEPYPGFSVGPEKSFVPVILDTCQDNASMVLFPETRRQEALEFIQGCQIASSSLLLTTVQDARPEDGNEKVVALLFSAPVDNLPVANIANVRVTDEQRKISHYFNKSQ